MKFHLGEIAILWGPGYRQHLMECTILRVGPFPAGVVVTGVPPPDSVNWTYVPSDYEIEDSDGYAWFCDEANLRKKRPPIPDEVLTIFETRKRVIAA